MTTSLRSLLALALMALLSIAPLGCKKEKKEGPTPNAQVAPPAAVGAAPAQGPLALDGAWRVTTGKDARGKPYAGNLTAKRAGEVWELEWKLADGTSTTGVGLDLGGGALGVGWGGAGAYGVVVYQVTGGVLKGRWAQRGVAGVGTEDLDGPAGLNGVYKITAGRSPAGPAYTGTVTIRPAGAVYTIGWSTGGTVQQGVGILEGNRLVSGWGDAGGAGFARYVQTAPGRLDGKWAAVGDTALGAEVLER